MDEFGDLVKAKLEEYGYIIYNINPTSANDEYCIMTDNMMVFTNGIEKSITVSFECKLDPEVTAQNMMVLNEVEETRTFYISESYYLDVKNKNYVMGEEAKKMATKELTDLALREMAKEQVYAHILTTQKCHEC
jgi:hypothetical protein